MPQQLFKVQKTDTGYLVCCFNHEIALFSNPDFTGLLNDTGIMFPSDIYENHLQKLSSSLTSNVKIVPLRSLPPKIGTLIMLAQAGRK